MRVVRSQLRKFNWVLILHVGLFQSEHVLNLENACSIVLWLKSKARKIHLLTSASYTSNHRALSLIHNYDVIASDYSLMSALRFAVLLLRLIDICIAIAFMKFARIYIFTL